MAAEEHPTDAAWAEAAARDAALSAAARKARGVVHTPPALARFVVAQALDLAPEPPTVLVDPAVGTGMFPAALLELRAAQPAGTPAAVLGCDLDTEAIAASERTLARPARALGVSLTLHAGSALELDPAVAPGGVPVVVGNPPWASKSGSRGAGASEALLDDFRRDAAGAPLSERKIGVLSDDYVRFVRWAVEVVRRSPRGGVLALVTNGSWLDGPVHRGMRAALMRWLDEIVLVDLGGSALVSRAAAVRDENVFGVRPGVVIVVGARRPGTDEPRAAAVRYVRLAGTAAEKLALLARATTSARGAASALLAPASLPLEVLEPAAPHFPFVRRARTTGGYASAPSLEAWMPFHREGVQTNRDGFAVDTDGARLEARLAAFARGALDGGEIPRGSAHFELGAARRALAGALERAAPGALVRPLAYRPLDRRAVVVHPSVCHRPRPELLAALDRSELALVTTRKDRGALVFRHLAVVDAAPDNCLLSARSSCRARAFPTHTPDGRPNVGAGVAAALAALLGGPPPPRLAAAYVAAWLGAPSYQRAYDEALRADYPRVPLPASAAELRAVARAGELLVAAWIGPLAAGASLEFRARALVIGHHRVLEQIERARPEARAEALARASAIVRAEDACDAAIAEALLRLGRG